VVLSGKWVGGWVGGWVGAPSSPRATSIAPAPSPLFPKADSYRRPCATSSSCRAHACSAHKKYLEDRCIASKGDITDVAGPQRRHEIARSYEVHDCSQEFHRQRQPQLWQHDPDLRRAVRRKGHTYPGHGLCDLRLDRGLVAAGIETIAPAPVVPHRRRGRGGGRRGEGDADAESRRGPVAVDG